MTPLLLATTIAFGAPLDPTDVPSGATWVLHVDLERAFASSLGSLVVDPEKRSVTLGLEGEREFDQFRTDYGVDPLTDLHSLTMFGSGADPREGVVLMKANSTVGHLVTRFATPEFGHSMVTIAGRDLHAWTQGGETHYVHVGGSGEARRVLFSQSTNALSDAIDVLESGHPSFDVARTPTSGSIVFAMTTDPGSFTKAGFQSNLLTRAESIVVDLGEREGEVFADVRLMAADERHAQDLAGMAQGMLAVGRMMAPEEPRVRDAMKLLDGVTFAVEGREVRASCTAKADALKVLMRESD